MPMIGEQLEGTFTVHKLWEAQDRDALLEEVTGSIVAIAMGGHVDVDGAVWPVTVDPHLGDQWMPRVAGDKIVWMDHRNDPTGNEFGPKNADIYLHDLSTGKTTAVTTDPALQEWLTENDDLFEGRDSSVYDPDKAKELIEYDEMNFSEIAYELGYHNLNPLSGQFKQVTGMSMSEYKRMNEKPRQPLDKIL